MDDQLGSAAPPRRYLWPWIVLGFFLLGVGLAVVSVRREAQRVREQRIPTMQESGSVSTNFSN